MSALLDTSYVVRYLTGDPPHLFEIARRVIDGDEELLLSPVVIAESAYALMTFYAVPRAAVVDQLVDLLNGPNIQPLGIPRPLAIQALLLCRPSGRISFADALTWAEARAARVPVVYSFDQRFPADGIEVRAAANR